MTAPTPIQFIYAKLIQHQVNVGGTISNQYKFFDWLMIQLVKSTPKLPVESSKVRWFRLMAFSLKCDKARCEVVKSCAGGAERQWDRKFAGWISCDYKVLFFQETSSTGFFKRKCGKPIEKLESRLRWENHLQRFSEAISIGLSTMFGEKRDPWIHSSNIHAFVAEMVVMNPDCSFRRPLASECITHINCPMWQYVFVSKQPNSFKR